MKSIYLTETELASLEIGQKIGVYYWNSVGHKYIYLEGVITDQTPKFWIVFWAGEKDQKFRKSDGQGYGRDNNDYKLCSMATVKAYQEEELKEKYQARAKELKCQYSPEFQQDLMDLIKKHKKVS